MLARSPANELPLRNLGLHRAGHPKRCRRPYHPSRWLHRQPVASPRMLRRCPAQRPSGARRCLARRHWRCTRTCPLAPAGKRGAHPIRILRRQLLRRQLLRRQVLRRQLVRRQLVRRQLVRRQLVRRQLVRRQLLRRLRHFQRWVEWTLRLGGSRRPPSVRPCRLSRPASGLMFRRTVRSAD